MDLVTLRTALLITLSILLVIILYRRFRQHFTTKTLGILQILQILR